MKKTILMACFIVLSMSGTLAQVVKTSFKGGGLNVIPSNFSVSGETRIYTYSPGGEFDNSVGITVYGNDFSTIEKEFSIQKPMPVSRKAECASISIKDLSLRFKDETIDKTHPYNLQISYWDENEGYVTVDLSDISELLPYYNARAELFGLPQYESINTPEAFANIMSMFGSSTRAGNDEGWTGFRDGNGNICCYYKVSYYDLDHYFYEYEVNGYKYPIDYYTIENNVIYHIVKSYGMYLYFPENYVFNWKQVEYNSYNTDSKISPKRGFLGSLNYSDFDNLTVYWGEEYNPFLTQTLFNNDDKYEYFAYNYEVGDWKTLEEARQDENIYIDYNEYHVRDYLYIDKNSNSYDIADMDSIVDLYGITSTSYDNDNFYLFRKQYFRNVKLDGFKVLSDDGNTIFSYNASPGAKEGVEAELFTYNNKNYMYVYDVDYQKNAYNYSIFEILPNNTSVKVIERVGQPIASAQDGVINMQLDDSHTNSNAELYNMSGQSVGKRYIPKGETRPQMNATGLPDGIYNLILNRNGVTISSQKMLIK